MRKKLFTLLLAIVAGIGTMFAAGTQIGGIYYILHHSNYTATVTYKGAEPISYMEYSGNVTIPESFRYGDNTYVVTRIGEGAFYCCENLISVTIPGSVTIIGDQAFSGCINLSSVTIPGSVTSIGYSAFKVCNNLTSVTIPNCVIGEDAFNWCTGLTSVTIGGGVIGSNAFELCNNLTSVLLGDGVTSIERRAFYNCNNLTSITIPNSVTSIGQYAFSKCSSLAFVTIGNSVTSIGDGAFQNCSGLTSVSIPNSVTSIGSVAFKGCTSLISVTIPNSVTSIGGSAFYNCSGLTSVTIGNSVISIGSSAFDNCSALATVIINSNSILKRAYNSSSSLADIFGSQVENYIIGNSVTSIGEWAFGSCSGLTSVTIPNSVTSIGSSAFSGCTGLTSVHISDLAAWCAISFGNYYANPLYYAHNLYLNETLVSDLIIPNDVTSIGNNAFDGCTALTSVTIPNSVTSIGLQAFFSCSGLTSVTNYATMPQTINSNVFNYVDKSSCKLYVPIEAVSAYQAAAVWQDFPIGGAAVSSKADPDNTSAYYTTFFDSSNKYRLPAGMEAYTAIINGDVLSLTKVAEGGEVIPANEAFILKSNTANLNMDITEADPVAVGPNALLGVDAATPAPANCYVLSGKSSDNSAQGLGFYQFSGTLGAHKAYLVLGGGASGAPRRLRFSFNETNTATGVEQVPSNQVPGTKVIENGALYIMYNGTKYNVQGARVE